MTRVRGIRRLLLLLVLSAGLLGGAEQTGLHPAASAPAAHTLADLSDPPGPNLVTH